MVAPHRSQAHSRRSLLHWAHRRLLQPLAAPPLSPSLDFRFACFAHCARRSSVPLGARFVRPRRTRRRGRWKCERALPLSLVFRQAAVGINSHFASFLMAFGAVKKLLLFFHSPIHRLGSKPRPFRTSSSPTGKALLPAWGWDRQNAALPARNGECALPKFLC